MRTPNAKWVFNNTVSASNRVPIHEIYFGCQERQNLNLGILTPGDLYAESVLFWFWLLEKTKNGH
jgi:hypothetical protein